jgi:hypothetical protein
MTWCTLVHKKDPTRKQMVACLGGVDMSEWKVETELGRAPHAHEVLCPETGKLRDHRKDCKPRLPRNHDELEALIRAVVAEELAKGRPNG